ncbi:MAG: RHS repeat-associated core domain-containing protein [Desulfovibrionales bacterium]|nr:RHS repeat-associated core domain-containing protein [Desulfovibrionales bacterium]
MAEADGANNITRYYIHGLGLMAMVTPSDEVYCYHFNAIGSTVAMTDQSQNIVNKYAYDPFGKVLNQQEAISQPFKFVGQYGVMTEPNGFYYMRARYYDPNVGRFISEDPIGFEGGDVNLYAYVGNNPIMLIDPLGVCSVADRCASLTQYYVNQSGLNNLPQIAKTAGIVTAVGIGAAVATPAIQAAVPAARTAYSGAMAAAGTPEGQRILRTISDVLTPGPPSTRGGQTTQVVIELLKWAIHMLGNHSEKRILDY